MNQTSKTRKMVTMAMLAAVAYVVMLVGRIPVVLFLKYDPKDVIIAIGGFLFGPMSAFLISLAVSVVEFFAASDTGIIGLIMNVISTCSFACVAALIYRKKHTIRGAMIGLIAGTGVMTVVMLLWNYLITPIYMDLPRETVAGMLLTAFLPFNLLKGGLNAAITMLLYKPIVTALRRSGLVPPSDSVTQGEHTKKHQTGIMILSVMILITCILLVLVLRGII